ncbi:hypothetical protein [Nodularia chucula]|uniref:hypothetical protein n=1 Tax=Nodularia chucula TaxID=3093667 RepID=UPI0039C72304
MIEQFPIIEIPPDAPEADEDLGTKVHVERVNPAPTPLQLRLLCNVTAKWPEDFHPFSSQEYQPIIADIPAKCHTS